MCSAYISFQKLQSLFKLVLVFDLADGLEAFLSYDNLLLLFFNFCQCEDLVRKFPLIWLLSHLFSEKAGEQETLTSVGPRSGLQKRGMEGREEVPTLSSTEHFDHRESC